MSRTWRLLLWPLLVVAAVGASFAYLDMDTAGLFSGKGLGQMAAYASEFFPPDLSAPHLRAIGRGLLETLAMSAIGTLLAALLGLLFALPAAGRFGVPAQSLARLLLNALRAVPELVWGALMVLAAGTIVLLDSLDVGIVGILVPLWFFILACGFSFPCTQVLALANHGSEAGTAASLLGALNFGLAGLISPIVGLFGIDNAIPMGSVMGITAIVSVIVLWTVVRPRTVPALSR